MSGSDRIGSSTPPSPTTPPSPSRKDSSKGRRPQTSNEPSKTRKTNLRDRIASTNKPSSFLKSESYDSGFSSEEETSFTDTNTPEQEKVTAKTKTPEQKKAAAKRKKLSGSLQRKLEDNNAKGSYTPSDWKSISSSLIEIKQLSDLAGPSRDSLHESIQLYTSLKQALENEQLSPSVNHAQLESLILYLVDTAAVMATQHMPNETYQMASAGLSSSLATDKISSWMMFNKEAKESTELFDDSLSQESFGQLCKDMALRQMVSPNQEIHLPPPPEEVTTKERLETESKLNKELDEMRSKFATQGKISFPTQSRSDILRTPISLVNGEKQTYDTKPALISMNTLSDMGKVSSEQRNMIANAQEGKVTGFLQGLEPEQQMQIIARLSQIEQLDMSIGLTNSLQQTIPEWGFPSPANQSKRVTVTRNGDTVTVTHSLEATLTFMSPLDGAVSAVQFNDGPPAKLSRTIIFEPGQTPQIGPLSMSLTLTEGELH
ncbi:hypothetical protein EOPP23_21215 [Endozoicomonas sp. OPT23]|uniref:hypothetical protein n=1 Tax=Endozoicomonas sp. OPT23 TaxID=2072845 RepID=UPI00129A9ABF|nr:hypothetical protein [Endozoicomonas sp. OPT23]MRI35483.1 hypothetical protein [Endozoicomonas sp. OPT23]